MFRSGTMNINIFTFFVTLSIAFSDGFRQENNYLDKFVHAGDALKSSSKSITKSFGKYAHLVKQLSESLTPIGLYEKNDFLQNQNDVFADNVTVLPTVQTTEETPKVSELCGIHAQGFLDGIDRQELWALQMLDAAGKPPANILGGGLVWLGDYDECLSTNGYADNNEIRYEFDGGYCMMSVQNVLPIPPILNQVQTFKIGTCLPASCNEQDAVILVDAAVKNRTNNLFYAYAAECQEPDRPYDTRAFVVIVVISFFISLMAAGTAYDLALIQWPKWQQETREKILGSDDVMEASEKVPLITDKLPEVNYEPGIFGKMLLSFSVYTNASKLLSTEQNGGSLTALGGIRFISMTWVILGHSYVMVINETGVFGKILLAFSVYTNASKLLSTEQNGGSLTAINGIRFISMTWVILGHSYIFVLNETDNALTFLPAMLKRYTFPAVSNALVSVDTFFVLSGTLLAYLTLKELQKNDGRLNWGMFYFHRFWRLTPPYMLVLMTYVSLFPYVGSGPMWKKEGVEYDYCKTGWFYNLLYVNNFVDEMENMCMSWGWYLANDMQFFVLSPILIVSLFFLPILGYVLLMAFLIGSWIATGVMATQWNVPMTMFEGGDMTHWGKMYFRPYFRMGPYLVGLLTGYLLYKTKLKFQINKYLNLLGWTVAAVVACAVLYGNYDSANGNQPSRDITSLYITVHRTCWGAAIAWVIFSCAHGYGGFINTLLSWKPFIPLGRLTYCAYLIHPIIIYHYEYTRRRLIHFTDVEIIYQFLGNLVLSYAGAFIVSLAFEAPMMGLEKALFKRNKEKK